MTFQEWWKKNKYGMECTMSEAHEIWNDAQTADREEIVQCPACGEKYTFDQAIRNTGEK
jgi:hypothetical protein